MRGILAAHVDSGEVPVLACLVSRRGETEVQGFGRDKGGSARDTIFRIASLTKPITAAAAMVLVEECRIRLDDPVDDFLPELANRRVLIRPDALLNETVPANRSITLRDLLTLRMGIGHIMAPGEYPIMKAAQERGLLTGPPQPQAMPKPDEWIARVGALPLIYQPGEQWMYDLGLDVLGVLVARASGQTLDSFVQERLFEPLGMKETGFSVPRSKVHRLPTCFRKDPNSGELVVYDEPEDTQWSGSIPFPSGSGGLVSTIDDYFAFSQMLMNKGVFGGERVLSRASVELMTSDQITNEQRAANPIFFGTDRSWGFGMGVVTRRLDYPNVGSYGWTGGLGTLAFNDPREELIAILFTQRMMDSPLAPKVFRDFQSCAYQAIAD